MAPALIGLSHVALSLVGGAFVHITKIRKMEQGQIDKMFEGRWRVKSQNLQQAVETMLIEYRIDYVKKLCRDFFEAGIILGDKDHLTSEVHIVCGETFQESVAEVISNSFDAFWSLYDKKVGKPKAEKLWDKLSAKEKHDCLAYIPLYKQAQPDKQYRKNPETFLRNKCWNDELIFRNNGNNKPTIEQQRIDKLTDILVGEYRLT